MSSIQPKIQSSDSGYVKFEEWSCSRFIVEYGRPKKSTDPLLEDNTLSMRDFHLNEEMVKEKFGCTASLPSWKICEKAFFDQSDAKAAALRCEALPIETTTPSIFSSDKSMRSEENEAFNEVPLGIWPWLQNAAPKRLNSSIGKQRTAAEKEEWQVFFINGHRLLKYIEYKRVMGVHSIPLLKKNEAMVKQRLVRTAPLPNLKIRKAFAAPASYRCRWLPQEITTPSIFPPDKSVYSEEKEALFTFSVKESGQVRCYRWSNPRQGNSLSAISEERGTTGEVLQLAETLSEEANKAKKEACLDKIWPRLENAVPKRFKDKMGKQKTAAEKREWLKENFKAFNWISVIDFSKLKLSSLPDEFLELELTQLEKLNLQDNELRTLPNEFGQKWTKLKLINLSNNLIEDLPDDFGRYWPNLTTVVLSKNMLMHLPKQFGASWNKLNVLDLRANRIRLPEDFGNNWNSLTVVDLADNDLNFLHDDFGHHWKNLRSLDLSKNQLTCLPKKFGEQWTRMRIIDLEENHLKALDEGFGKEWQNLEKISLENNHLSSLPDDFGQTWRGLNTLKLHKNHLTHLPSNFGNGWEKLKSIYLNNNALKTLGENFGQKWSGLQDISLSENGLEFLPEQFGKNWHGLRSIGLVKCPPKVREQLQDMQLPGLHNL